MWLARGMGLEGRVDWERAVPADPRTDRPPAEIRVAHKRPFKITDDPLDPTVVPYDEIVYRLEQQADDWTLIYRRVTPAFREGER